MNKVIDKELISQLLRLEIDQQEKVLTYINEMLLTDEMNSRAAESEQAILEGKTKSFEQFNEGFEQWKSKKRASL